MELYDTEYSFRTGSAFWVGDWDFKTGSSTGKNYRVGDESLWCGFAEIEARQGPWGFIFGYEAADSSDMTLSSFTAQIGYHFQIACPMADDLSLHGGLHYSTVQVDDMIGDFDPETGFRGGLEFRKKLCGAWSFHYGGEYRYLKFDYDKSDESVAWERNLGQGGGWAALLGIDYRF
jgi:hypothetical protein